MGKYLVAFFSAGGSGIGNSGENMEALAKGAKVIGGRRFTSGVSEEEIRSWIDGLDLE